MHNSLVVMLTLLVVSVTILGSAACQVVLSLEGGFVKFVDIMSKIATVGVFVWAVYMYKENQNSKKEEKINSHINEFSTQIELIVQTKDYISNRSRLSILIRKLEELKKYCQLLNSDESNSKLKLILDVVCEQLKDVGLNDILGISSGDGFYENLEILEKIYSNRDSMREFDKGFSEYIERAAKKSPTTCCINAPPWSIQLWQVSKLVSLVFEVSEKEARKRLLEEPQILIGVAHHISGIFAFYKFYEDGTISIDKNDEICVHVCS